MIEQEASQQESVSIDEITLESLAGEHRKLAECIGIEKYHLLLLHYGGGSIYIPMARTAIRKGLCEDVRKNFNGRNYNELAKEWDVSAQTIRNIIRNQSEVFS